QNDVVSASQKHFDGSVPTIFLTTSGASPYHISGSMVNGAHLFCLSQELNNAFSAKVPAILSGHQPLSLAAELLSNVDFVGGTNAQFVVLFTALEVLIP